VRALATSALDEVAIEPVGPRSACRQDDHDVACRVLLSADMFNVLNAGTVWRRTGISRRARVSTINEIISRILRVGANSSSESRNW
jgi:hypothetical protein